MQCDNPRRISPFVYLAAMLALSAATTVLTYPAIRLGIIWHSSGHPTANVETTLKSGERLGGSLQRTWDGLIFTDTKGASYGQESIETLVLPPYIEGSPLPISHPKTFLPPLALYVFALTLGWLLYSHYVRATKLT